MNRELLYIQKYITDSKAYQEGGDKIGADMTMHYAKNSLTDLMKKTNSKKEKMDYMKAFGRMLKETTPTDMVDMVLTSEYETQELVLDYILDETEVTPSKEAKQKASQMLQNKIYINLNQPKYETEKDNFDEFCDSTKLIPKIIYDDFQRIRSLGKSILSRVKSFKNGELFLGSQYEIKELDASQAYNPQEIFEDIRKNLDEASTYLSVKEQNQRKLSEAKVRGLVNAKNKLKLEENLLEIYLSKIPKDQAQAFKEKMKPTSRFTRLAKKLKQKRPTPSNFIGDTLDLTTALFKDIGIGIPVQFGKTFYNVIQTNVTNPLMSGFPKIKEGLVKGLESYEKTMYNTHSF